MINLIIHASEAGIATQIKAMESLLDETKYNLSFDLSGPAKNILQKRPKMNLEAADLVICGFDDIKIDLTSTLLSICLTIVSICLSLITTPCNLYTS